MVRRNWVRGLWALAAAVLATSARPTPSIAAPPPPVEDYGKLPGMELVRLSPSGQLYAFVAQVGETRRLIVATTKNELVVSDDLAKVKVVGLQWAGDDHLLVHISSTVDLGVGWVRDKDELASVVVMNVKQRKAFSVFNNSGQEAVAHTVVGTYGTAQIDGHWYGFFGGYTYEADHGGRPKQDGDGRLFPDLYRVDLDTGKFSVVAEGQSNSAGWLIGPDGTIAARARYDERSGDWRVLAGKWGGAVLASGRSPFAGADLAGFGRTPDTILVATPGDKGSIYQELSLTNGEVKETIDAEAVSEPLIDPITQRWIGVVRDSDTLESTLFAPALESKLRGALQAFPGYIVHLISYSADFNFMIVFTEGGDDSGTYWIVDIARRHADPLGEPYPTVAPAFVGPVRMVSYKAADGTALQGVLTLPPGGRTKDLPVVIMPHGGPAARDYPGFDYWAQAFAARGYAVFQPNFRGSTGYGLALHEAGYGQWGRKMQTDVSDGLAELARQGIVDPKRACIVGWSYGGYAALAGVTVQHGLYRCAVSMAGVSDLRGFLNWEREGTGAISSTTRWWKTFMGVTSNWTDNQVRDISPRDLADRADAPILLIHGKDDTVVPIDQSETMARVLRNAGKPVELITLTGADHWLLREDTRIAMLKASVAFVLKHNPPDLDPAAAQ